MAQASVNGQSAVDQTLDLMVRQCDALFSELQHITAEQLWFRAGPDVWSIGENVDHLRVVYASWLPWFKASWALFKPLARLRRNLPYRVEIDNVYHRPGFPQKVGWMWPSAYTPARPAGLDVLRKGIDGIHAQVRGFYAGKDPEMLGHVVLWDPAIGTLNLIQGLRVGVYHDEVHIASIREMLRAL